jgi:hypothetical protein
LPPRSQADSRAIAYDRTVLRRLPLLLVASLGSATACVLFPSVDGFSGADARGSTDAGSVDGQGRDAPSDGGSWCAAQGVHVFCTDFDSPDAFGAIQRSSPSAGATLELDSTEYASPPFALAAATPATGSATGSAELNYQETGRAQVGFRLALDLRLETASGANETVLIAAMIYRRGSSKARYNVQLDWQGGQLGLSEYAEDTAGNPVSGTSRWPLGTPIDLGAWYSVVVDVSADVSSASVALAKKPDLPAPVIGGVALRPTVSDANDPLLTLGLAWVASNTPAQRAHFDNLVFDWK